MVFIILWYLSIGVVSKYLNHIAIGPPVRKLHRPSLAVRIMSQSVEGVGVGVGGCDGVGVCDEEGGGVVEDDELVGVNIGEGGIDSVAGDTTALFTKSSAIVSRVGLLGAGPKNRAETEGGFMMD